MKLTINSPESLSAAIGSIREAYKEHPFLRLVIKTGKDRTLDQNAISHCWYEQISRELKEDTTAEVKCFCKLHYGVPILRADDEDFRALYDKSLKGLSYEDKLKWMSFLPITSIMLAPQLTRYLDTMQKEYAKRGVILEAPSE